MKLEECTKAELIFIIKRMSYFDDFHLNTALNDLEYKRVQAKIEEAERQASISEKYRSRYLEIAKKYAGKNIRRTHRRPQRNGRMPKTRSISG